MITNEQFQQLLRTIEQESIEIQAAILSHRYNAVEGEVATRDGLLNIQAEFGASLRHARRPERTKDEN